MGVYINGMEMPKCCFDCPCYHQKADAGYYDFEICGANRTIFNDGYSSVTGHKDHINPFKARLDNCPLVPVPSHGRLGDLDAAVEKLKKLREYHLDDSQSGVFIAAGISQCIDVLTGKDAPTIIPAEEDET